MARAKAPPLYQFTWEESAVELLKKLKKKYQAYFPGIATEAPKGPKALQARLEKAMESCTREQIQKLLEQELQTERRDLWQQLYINDAAFQAGIITETDYGLCLVEYLAAREKCHRDWITYTYFLYEQREYLCGGMYHAYNTF